MITRLTLFLLLTPLLLVASSSFTSFNKSKTIFDELVRDEVLEITLRTNLSPLLENRRSDEPEKAFFTFVGPDGGERSHQVKLELRGKYRRRICQFPPLMIKFKKDELRAQGFSEHNDIKLVTHCLDDKEAGNENVLREYLTYKLYNVFTEKSYRVQLVRVNYVDDTGDLGVITRYGFLIEDTDEMAERIGGEEYEKMNPEAGELLPADENRMAVFQYMIGNEDWSLLMGRNVKLVRLPSGQAIPVPYDFDFSGLVNTSYARPNTNIGLTSVRARAFMGLPVQPEMLEQTLTLFSNKKDLLYQTVKDFRLLNRRSRRDVMEYLDSFYDNLEVLVAANQTLLEAPQPVEKPEGI